MSLKFDINEVKYALFNFCPILLHLQDVQSTAKLLPNVKLIKIPSPSFNHIDFLFGNDADIYIYNNIIDILQKSYNMSCGNSL